MKRKFYFALAFPLAVLGGVAVADFGVGRDLGNSGTSGYDSGQSAVPDVPPPTCVDCGPGYHCNAARNGCVPDDPPKDPPQPKPKPEEKPVDVPA